VIEMDLAANARLLPNVLAPNGVVAIYGRGASETSIPFQFLLQTSIPLQFFLVYLMPPAERDSVLKLAEPVLVVADWGETGVPTMTSGALARMAAYPDAPLRERVSNPARAIGSGGSTGRPKLIVHPGHWVYAADASLATVLGIRPGQTTPDGRVSLEVAECLAACEEAPVLLADGDRVAGATPDGVDELVRRLRADA